MQCGQRSVIWLKLSQPCLHHLHVLSTTFSWQPLSLFSLWIILLTWLGFPLFFAVRSGSFLSLLSLATLGFCANRCFFIIWANNVGGIFSLWIILLPPSLPPFILPLINQCDRYLVPLAWELMAGECGFASHWGITLSRSWLCQRCKPLNILGTHLHLAMQLLMAGKWEQGSCILPPTSTCYCSPGLKHLQNGFRRAYNWWGSYPRRLITGILSEIITLKNLIINRMHFNTFGRGVY